MLRNIFVSLLSELLKGYFLEATTSLTQGGTRGRLLGQPIGDRQIHRIFEQLRRQLRWVDRGAHGHPRVHDLRHSFAVRRLVLWHEQGEDVDQKMLALSTYLGHARISNTYWYLTGVPELMSLAAKRFELFADPWESDDE